MTAASGILHREYHEESFARRGGRMQMVQLWVNLPRAHKMSAPGYQAIESTQIGIATLADGAGQVRVIAGEYAGVRGPARTFTPIDLLDVQLQAGGSAQFAFPVRHNTALLVLSGPVMINEDDRVATNDLVVLAHDGEHFSVRAESAARILVLSGEPIDEPIVQYGPFVMNTPAEIHDAVQDFNRGAFGELAD
jgi:redox-sensitive bicupin YhaK (pirin superfamily)